MTTEPIFRAFSPALIPSTKQGRWKPVASATSQEIEDAIATEETLAREYDETGNELASLHWRRWLGLHHAYIRALAKEAR